MPRKFVISPTKLRMYYQCPMKYRLEYIEKQGRFYHRINAGNAFGHSLHRALDVFHNAGGAANVSAEELAASLDSVWVGGVGKGFAAAEQEAAFREEGMRILTEYHAARVTQTAPVTPVEGEEEVILPPPPHLLFTEKTLRIDLTPDVALSGRVDRVDEHHDGALEIVDYKYGRETVEEEDVSRSLALNIYQTLLKAKMPDRRVFATLVALRTGAQASHEQTEDARTELLAECTETGETLRNKDWEGVLPVLNEHCPYCDFLPHCTRWWKKNKIHDS